MSAGLKAEDLPKIAGILLSLALVLAESDATAAEVLTAETADVELRQAMEACRLDLLQAERLALELSRLVEGVSVTLDELEARRFPQLTAPPAHPSMPDLGND